MSVLVVTGTQPQEVQEGGAVGLYVPGRGLYVSRQEALDDLGQLPAETPCAPLQRCKYEIFVSVPPLGSRRNTRRYQVTIRGPGYEHALLVSDSTRIRGLVSVDDIRETIDALEHGRDPPIHARTVDHPLVAVAKLDGRLDDARRAQAPATVALVLTLLALTLAALVSRSAPIARAALLYPLAAVALALGLAALHWVGPVTTTLAMLVAASVALGLALGVRLEVATVIFLAGYGLVLAFAPDTNAQMAIGPHPWSGGRFYGVTNQLETLFLAPTLAAASVVRGGRFVALVVLTLAVVGGSKTGADGGGILVFTAAFVALWLLQRGRRLTPVWLVAVVVIGLAAVGLDALLGGSSHVVDAVSGGPGELLEDFGRRLDRSVSIITSTVGQFAVFVAGVAVLASFAALRPRFAVLDAFLIAIAVSLVVNDSPTKVVGFGAILAGALRSWSVSSAPIKSPR